MTRSDRLFWIGTALAVLAAALWETYARQPERTPAAAPAGLETARAEVRVAAAGRIAAESRTTAAVPSAQRPRGFEPTAAARRPRQTGGAPDGYSYTGAPRQMRVDTMANAGHDALRRPPAPARVPGLDTAGANLLVHQAAAAGRDWTFGFVHVAPDADVAALQAGLTAQGGALLGRGGAVVRARLPGDRDRLRAIVNVPGVAAVSATPATGKLPDALRRTAAAGPPDEASPLFVTLMTDDPDGAYRRALADLGVVVGRYDAQLRVYEANLRNDAVLSVAAADFVQAVEPIRTRGAMHDTAVPAMGADAVRTFDARAGGFAGRTGWSVPVGVLDTGLNVRHLDIGSDRASICGANFMPLFEARTQDQDLWVDGHGHGTHVTGTLLGSGSAQPRYAGMAPGVAHLRFAKVLNDFGFGTDTTLLRGIDFLGRPTGCGVAPPVKPQVVNVSLSEAGIDWRARSVAERKLDAAVWHHRQLYVVAAANAGFQALGDVAAAKNPLAVGAVHDSGDIASFSSHGPTGDGRLVPQVSATGVDVRSARGNGSRTGYVSFSGTSMASPAVAGVAALLIDAVPGFRARPAAVRARLMASAIRPDAFLDAPGLFPAHNTDGPGALQNRYGLGKVSARTAILNRDAADGWTGGVAVVEVDHAQYAYHDIAVPPDASRLDVVMTWDERPADTLVPPVLNDLDLWVDHGADCPPSLPAACGEASSSSTRDNVEWAIVRNPEPGTYRLKLVPKRAHVDVPRVALAWTVIRGPSTPQLEIAAGADAVSAASDAPFAVDLTVSTDGYVAAGAVLRIDCRAGDASVCRRLEVLAPKASSASREDAVTRTLEHDSTLAIALGEVAAGEEQSLRLLMRGVPGPERFRLHFTVSAWNARSATAAVDVEIGDASTAADGRPSSARPAPVPVPANDAYAMAERLSGEAGTTATDLLLATPEPGEPPALGRPGAPTERPRSVWYAWDTPRADTYRFSVDGDGPFGIADDVGIDLFEVMDTTPLAALRSAELKIGGGLTFAAEAGASYRIRVGLPNVALQTEVPRAIGPLTLRWSPAALPANDAFAAAGRIDGAAGERAGSNLGGTVEYGESSGPLAATTWFRWTAPADGDYRFTVDRRRLAVAAFTGNDVRRLRLVSGLPDTAAVFPARAGDEYRIVVGAEVAYASGSDYTLRWGAGRRIALANDDRAQAETMPDAAFLHPLPAPLAHATVEPGEPAATGVRTAWWRWTPPDDGVYTWRARRLLASRTMSAFRDDPETGLVQLAATETATRTKLELQWAARADTEYLVSIGVPADAAFEPEFEDTLLLDIGRAPGNDGIAVAEVLSEGSGTLSGRNDFATLEPGEDSVGLGDASVWWTWEAPADGWYRFSLTRQPGAVLAVYRRRADGELERAGASRRLGGSADAVFLVEGGATYLIRLGSTQQPGDFELSWAEHGAPAWLRFVGIVSDGDVDAAGRLLSIADPQALAFHPDGRSLYVVTADGLQVYARDPDNGGLALLQTLAEVDNDAVLLWDPGTRSLVSGGCMGWQRWQRGPSGLLATASEVQSPVPCSGTAALTDAAGAWLVLVVPGALETWRFNDGRTGMEEIGRTAVPGLGAAALRRDGDFVYAAAHGALHVLQRNPETDALEERGLVHDGMESGGRYVTGLADVTALALDDAQAVLFAFGAGGAGVAAFDLQDPAQPRFLNALEPFTGSSLRSIGNLLFAPLDDYSPPTVCAHASVRPGRLAVDVMCARSAFSVRLSDGTLRPEEDLNAGDVDRFERDVAEFDVTGSAAASPDGRHLYAGLPRGLLILARTPLP